MTTKTPSSNISPQIKNDDQKRIDEQARIDGWNNINNFLGTSQDKASGTNFISDITLDGNTLGALYRSNGFAKRIVDLIALEMTRQWFYVSGDTDGLILAKLEELNAKHQVTQVLKWARLFGGAIIVMGIDDRSDSLDMPVNESKIYSIDFLKVIDRSRIANIDLYEDLTNSKFGEPEFYNVMINSSLIKVHESRVLRASGEELPASLSSQNSGWSDSVLQGVYNELRNLGAAYNATNSIIVDFIQTTLSIENLGEMLGAGQDDLIKQRLNIIDMSRSVANTVLLDSTEMYNKTSSSVSGLDALIDRFSLALAATTGIPYTFLMGQSPAGLQSTGASDVRMFYDNIRGEQEDSLKPMLERLVRLIMISKTGGFNGVELENWKIEFNSLWQNTKEEEALYRKTVAETDAIYLNAGVLDPSEVAISRFGGNEFSSETTLDTSTRDGLNVDTNLNEIDDYLKQKQDSEAVKKDQQTFDADKEYLTILKEMMKS